MTDSIKALSVETLRARLKAIGYTAGPITAGTHRVYQRHLMRIRKNPQMLEEQDAESGELIICCRAQISAFLVGVFFRSLEMVFAGIFVVVVVFLEMRTCLLLLYYNLYPRTMI